VILSVLILCYLSVDGISNYLEGTTLLAIYVIFLVAFWYQPDRTTVDVVPSVE